MINIILYLNGKDSKRVYRLFVRSLNDSVNIVGYYSNNTLSFVQSPQVSEEYLLCGEYDYVILLTECDRVSNETYAYLRHNSVEEEKILMYSEYVKTEKNNGWKEYINDNNDYRGLIFGMSHSKVGVLSEILSKKIFKFTYSSADLFFYYKMILRIISESPERIKNYDYIFFEMPYYFFNYDLSSCKNIVPFRIKLLESIGDYHNYGSTQEEARVIHQYNAFERMGLSNIGPVHGLLNRISNIARQINKFDEWVYFRKKSNMLMTPLRRMFRNHSEVNSEEFHIWVKVNHKTVDENNIMWKEMINVIKLENPNIKIGVIVCPMNPAFISSNNINIDFMKSLFYKTIEKSSEEGIVVIDLFDYFKGERGEKNFYDHCHMDPIGCKKFSKELEVQLSKRVW